MQRSSRSECVLELIWRQTAPDDWEIELTDPRSGEPIQIRSKSEFEAFLDDLLRVQKHRRSRSVREGKP